MEQEKIGRFISELRKEQGMTQQQLADAIGVSNKTISKWECGKGMPEISSILPLCKTLHINVNELISGERLPEEGYSKKVEENMMNLIHETEISRKKNRSSLTIIFVTLIAVILGGGYILIGNFGTSMNAIVCWDSPTLFGMLVVAVLFLLGTKLGIPFLRAFVIAGRKGKEATRAEICQAIAALKLVSYTLLGMGIFESCVGLTAMMPMEAKPDFLWSLSISINITMLGVLYGLIGFLLLLPIRMKLEAMLT